MIEKFVIKIAGELTKYCKKLNAITLNRLNNLIRLGIVRYITNGQSQKVQVVTAAGEVLNNVIFLEPYGFTAKPTGDSETLVFNVQGNVNNRVVLNIGNRRLRFKELKDGEVALYDNAGSLVHLQNGGKMQIKSTNQITVKAAQILLDGPTELGGSGGQPVALLGCTVEVDPNTHKGTITSGATKVTGL